MSDALIIALEASFENDPVRMENKLWGAIEEKDREKDPEKNTSSDK